MNIVTLAFLLTLVAGLSTGIGSIIPFVFKSFKQIYLAFFLGLSAGVMIFVSFVDLLPHSLDHFSSKHWVFLSFFIGIALVVLIDLLIPKGQNPHHVRKGCHDIQALQSSVKCDLDVLEDIAEVRVSDMAAQRDEQDDSQNLLRLGIVTAIALAIHNFPEGIATFASTLADPKIGISITLAIAIHNIPEGMCVSVPIYFATRKKWKSLLFGFLSGLTEPLGAIVAYGLTSWFLTDHLLAASFAFVAGIMVYISLDELIPTAFEYGKRRRRRGHHPDAPPGKQKGHIVILGIVTGMAIMAGSLLLFDR